MKNSSPITVEVARYPAHEMAFVLVNQQPVFTGNYWDFHSGCHGSKIGGYDLTGLWDRGVDSLATALKVAMEKKGLTVKVSSKTLTTQEYKKLGF